MKILNIGSLNIDKTYSLKNFVQPKETVRALEYKEFCGGKGLNQSTSLAKAKADVYHAGAVGTDGKQLVDMLESSGVNTKFIKWTDGVSGHAVIQLDETGQNNIIIVGGANEKVEKGYIDSVLDNFDSDTLVLLQNEISNVDYIIREAKKRGMKIAFNPSPVNDDIYNFALDSIDYFILNEVEGMALSGISSEKPDDIKKALLAKYPNANFVLTLGEEGSLFFSAKESIAQKGFKVKAVDTTGAGDTFTGYFLAGVTRGSSFKECLREAGAASAIAVTRQGAAQGVPGREEVEEFLKENC